MSRDNLKNQLFLAFTQKENLRGYLVGKIHNEYLTDIEKKIYADLFQIFDFELEAAENKEKKND